MNRTYKVPPRKWKLAAWIAAHVRVWGRKPTRREIEQQFPRRGKRRREEELE